MSKFIAASCVMLFCLSTMAGAGAGSSTTSFVGQLARAGAISQASVESLGPEAPPDLAQLVKKWLSKLGWLGALVVSLGLLWWNWDKIEKLPFVKSTLGLVTRKPIARASPDRFTVAVTHFENDTDEGNETLLLAELQEFSGLTVLRVDRCIRVGEGKTLQESIAIGHSQARSWIGKCGAQALVWGKIVKTGGPSELHLRLTTACDTSAKPNGLPHILRFGSGRHLELWRDLIRIAGFFVRSTLEDLRRPGYIPPANRLHTFADNLGQLLTNNMSEWPAEEREALKFAQAWVLANEANMLDKNEAALNEIIERYKALVDTLQSREFLTPLDLASGFNVIGTARLALAKAKIDQDTGQNTSEGHKEVNDLLQQALIDFNQALWHLPPEDQRSNDQAILLCADIWNNLGSARLALGEREPDPDHIHSAITAFENALSALTQERYPLKWAVTVNNLARARAVLGIRKSDAALLADAVDSCEQALQVFRNRGEVGYIASAEKNLSLARRALSNLRNQLSA